ncbi:ABC-2 type transport system ATP-binding protein [Micromonospora sp. M71_S20]|uniref:ABC transporter ATP-binding protein n=1 Tax=Micromonospora sp. M71_S20 TaxID=592872 RepID=UPI000EB52CA9|nr:ABC transporter ATP-binding protein [Micromonospora sp. M71_S20]RLK23063.1 ABC-2 type transport system ATP-binding protein [Micromonospora sp. M71_S20]
MTITSPPAPPDAAVTLDGLTKRYGARTAVDQLTMHIPRGSVAGFVGPNGAGKTTAMAMLLGLVRPSAGTATVLGHPISQPARYLGRVGALIETPGFYPALTGLENLRVLAAMGGHDVARIPRVLEQVGLGGRGSSRFGQYSLGMKQRLGIAGALLGDPELVILDEPTNGLDPLGMSEMRELIAGLAGQGRTVMVSSHLLGELEQVCDWLLILDHGELVYQGATEAFAVGVELSVAAEGNADTGRLAELLVAAGYPVRRRGDELVVQLGDRDGRTAAAHVNRIAHAGGVVLSVLHRRRPSLEDQVLARTGGNR